MAENLFSRLDASGQGYIEKSDLQTAFDGLASNASTTSVDDMFSQLDTDSDGKVTKQEFSDVLRKVAEELDNQAMSMRIKTSMQDAGGMPPPPPPPPPQDDAGFIKEESSARLDETGAAGASSETTDAKLMFQIMRLMQAYAISGESNGTGGSISVSA